jgi:hypothetical protein
MRGIVSRRGRLVLVGGHSRGVGKTLFIEEWLRAQRSVPWTAVKVSAHRHAAAGAVAPLIEEAATPTWATQTGRYLAAGAARALLVRAPDTLLPAAAAWIDAQCDRGANVIVESNRLVRYLNPERLFFVIDPAIADWKPSSAACLSAANVILCSQRKLRHDHHVFRYEVGDGAAVRGDSVHRLALSRAVAARAAGTGRAG